MDIKLNEILNISVDEYRNWTLCLNNGENSLEETLSDENKENKKRLMYHLSYKTGSERKRSFRKLDKKYCLQFLGLHKSNRYNDWLFIGAFEIGKEIHHNNGDITYDLKKMDRFANLAERLVIRYKKHQGDTQVKLNIENIETVNILEILPDIYVKQNKPFPGYKNFSVDFRDLASIINNNVTNWRAKLTSVQCIYAITDMKAKKIYVGSTYGSDGIWQRWSTYVATNGHGGNVELKKLVDKDPNYAYNYFKFSILEFFYDENSKNILERENDWKTILQAKPFGYNLN